MKDNSTLKSLNRKFELEFKEAQLFVSRLEQILIQRKEAEGLVANNIFALESELESAKMERKKLFLSGTVKADSIREELIQKKLKPLRKKLIVASGEIKVAEERINKAKAELELLYKQREGFLKINDEREIQKERIKVEAGDSD